MTSTRSTAPDITDDELQALLGEITSTAEKAEEHGISTDIDDITSLRAAFFVMRERIAYMGWIGDRIAQRAGLEETGGVSGPPSLACRNGGQDMSDMQTEGEQAPKNETDEDHYQQIRAMPAALTKEEMRKMEESFQKDLHGVARRAALAVLTNSCAYLFEQIESDRAAATAIMDALFAIDEYLEHLRGVTETVAAASERLTVGLSLRDDMQEILEEVKAARAA